MGVPDLCCLPWSCQTLAGKEQFIVDSKEVFGTRIGSELEKKGQGEGIRSIYLSLL